MRLLLLGIVAALGAGSCAPPDTAHLYRVLDKAASYSSADIEALQHLGPTFADKGVNFGVYSQRATRLDLLLFDDPASSKPARIVPLTRFGDVWNTYVEGI